jgi:hypothetical protein
VASYVAANASVSIPGGEPGYAPRECSPRFIAVSDGIQATVFDRLIHQDLFPTTTGNRSRECGIGTAAMIAEALNFHEANAGVRIPGGGQGNDSCECSVLSAVQAEIGEWARTTFPQSTKESWVAHMLREVGELAENHSPEEAADCHILLLGHAHINGYDLLSATLAKMAINRNRKWGKPDHEGVVEHEEPNKSSPVGEASPDRLADKEREKEKPCKCGHASRHHFNAIGVCHKCACQGREAE